MRPPAIIWMATIASAATISSSASGASSRSARITVLPRASTPSTGANTALPNEPTANIVP